MRFDTIKQGFVCQHKPTDAQPVAAGPRCVVASNQELVCTYMVQSKLGINDFVPMLARSADSGRTWREQGPVWPDLRDRWSFFVALSRGENGDLYLFGSRYQIDAPGESFWSDATQGLKQNDLVWAVSKDHGRSWSPPQVIPILKFGKLSRLHTPNESVERRQGDVLAIVNRPTASQVLSGTADEVPEVSAPQFAHRRVPIPAGLEPIQPHCHASRPTHGALPLMTKHSN